MFEVEKVEKHSVPISFTYIRTYFSSLFCDAMFMQQTNEYKSAVSDPIMMPVSESVDPSFVKYIQG